MATKEESFRPMTALPKLADLVDKSFDPFVVEKLSHGDADDPYPRIHDLQARGTVHKGSYRELFTDVPDVQLRDQEQYLVLGYDAVLQVLSDPRTFTNREAFQHTLGVSFG
ncbi:MAG TPA: cytochrome P450, partial [Candidatus Dormibacteraeota bacterium]|nr:cytochrome P450 [Candidatus Dormibacteraeota bacterium]